jgi:MoxR-like ATPase
MSQIVLTDEINRATPKTRSSLLNVWKNARSPWTVTYPIPSRFFLMATQNPIEYEGTFPFLKLN